MKKTLFNLTCKVRLILDTFRLIVFYTTEFDSWLYNISRSLGLLWYLFYIFLLASLVDTWVHLCIQFLPYAKALKWINYFIIIMCSILNLISAAVSVPLMCFPLSSYERKLGDDIVRFISYPIYILSLVALSIILIVAGVLILREMKNQSSKWNMKNSSQNEAIRKIFSAIIVTIISSVLRVIASVGVGLYMIETLGEWISSVTYVPEFTSLLIIGFVFFPWKKITCCAKRIEKTKKENLESKKSLETTNSTPETTKTDTTPSPASSAA